MPTIRGLLCNVAFAVLPLDSWAATQQAELDIFRLELVSHLDATIERGAFDTAGPVDRRIVKDVKNCVEVVRKEVLDWVSKEQLVLSREDHRDSLLILHIEPRDKRGIYELVYRVNVVNGYATGAFKYFDVTGAPLSAPLSAYRDFCERLRKAMLCE